ncbi:hypothetical protein HDV00_005843 [Rhizophlyctis rosea]|nr:hypothetical protein HDV00_005843 [Rhizophlyctis rosea]
MAASPSHPHLLQPSTSDQSLNDVPILPPAEQTHKTPFLIGVAGGASSGKKEVCRMMLDELLERDPELKEKVVSLRVYRAAKRWICPCRKAVELPGPRRGAVEMPAGWDWSEAVELTGPRRGAVDT